MSIGAKRFGKALLASGIAITLAVTFCVGAVVGVVYGRGPEPTKVIPAPNDPPNRVEIVMWKDEHTLWVTYSDSDGTWFEWVTVPDNHGLSLEELKRQYPAESSIVLTYDMEQVTVPRRMPNRHLVSQLPVLESEGK